MNGEGRVLKHLKEHGAITSWDAISLFGITRLSAVIFRLRNKGYKIETENTTGENRYGESVTYAKYTLTE